MRIPPPFRPVTATTITFPPAAESYGRWYSPPCRPVKPCLVSTATEPYESRKFSPPAKDNFYEASSSSPPFQPIKASTFWPVETYESNNHEIDISNSQLAIERYES